MASPTFSFTTVADSSAAFTVLSFDGYEALSQLYRYVIQLKLPNPSSPADELDLDAVLNANATFTMHHDGVDHPIHGMLSDFTEMQVTANYTVYEAVLVPRLWRLSLYRTNEIFVKKTGLVNDAVSIVREVLVNAGFVEGASADFEFGVTGTLLDREYVCQFRESDFDFIARMLEQEGLYFYFVQSAAGERMVVTDSATYTDIGLSNLTFDVAAAGDAAFRSISAWSCRNRRIANAVTVRDYDPAQPSLDVSGIYPTSASTVEADYLYGERSIDQADAERIAQRRYELLDCEKTLFYGESGICELRPGRSMGFGGHPKASYTGQSFLLVEVEHRGRGLDSSSVAPGPGNSGAHGPGASASAPQYANSIVAMPSGKPFRPPLTTPKPRFHGTMTAFVYAESGSDRAEIDDQGRYRVVLPFDRAGGAAADTTGTSRKASYWMRMMQTYVGEDSGSFFPLKGGAEVLLSFINGDPDYPVIVGAVPNARTPSLLTADTAHIATISTDDLLSIRADGGAHIDLSVEATEEKSRATRKTDSDDFSFPKFTGVDDTNARQPLLDGGSIDTMTPAQEKDGTVLIEREYGNRHQYQDGDTYSWGHRNANVYSFGPGYEQTHMDVHPEDLSTLDALKATAPAMTESTNFSRDDRATGKQTFTFTYPRGASDAGPEDDYAIWGVASMSKVWGDVFEYQHGQTYQWAHNSNKTFSYGNGYSESLMLTDRGEFSNIETEVQGYDGVTDWTMRIGRINAMTDMALKDTQHDFAIADSDPGTLLDYFANNYWVNPAESCIDKAWGTSFSYHNGLEVEVHEGNTVSRNYGDTDEHSIGNSYTRYDGYTEESFRGEARRYFWGASLDFFFGSNNEIKLSNSASLHVGAAQDIFVGGSLEIKLPGCLQFSPFDTDVKNLKIKVAQLETEIKQLKVGTEQVEVASKTVTIKNEPTGITTGLVAMRKRDLEVAIATGVSVEQVNGLKVM